MRQGLCHATRLGVTWAAGAQLKAMELYKATKGKVGRWENNLTKGLSHKEKLGSEHNK